MKRYDEEKETKYWMADYRFLTFPGFNAKMKDFTVLAMIKEQIPPYQITSLTGAKNGKITDLITCYNSGKSAAEDNS